MRVIIPVKGATLVKYATILGHYHLILWENVEATPVSRFVVMKNRMNNSFVHMKAFCCCLLCF